MKELQQKLLSESKTLKLHPYHDELLPLDISDSDITCLNDLFRKIRLLCPNFKEGNYTDYDDSSVKVLAKMLWHKTYSDNKYMDSVIVFRDPADSKHIGLAQSVLYEADLIRTFPDRKRFVKHCASTSFADLCNKVYNKARVLFKLGGNA